MTPLSVVLAIIPPAFALLVEYFNPVSEASIFKSLETDLKHYDGISGFDNESLKKQVLKITSGAVEVAGLTPTFVACLTSGFGVLADYPNPWVGVGYVLLFLALLLFLLRFLSGQSYLDISEKAVPINFLIYKNDTGRSVEVLSAIIYAANVFLIGFVLIIFAVSTNEEAPRDRKPPCLQELPCQYVGLSTYRLPHPAK
jgi:hypothetical protein